MGEIMKNTGRPKTSVYFHIKDIRLSPRLQKEIFNRARQRINSFNHSQKGKSRFGRHPRKFTHWTKSLVCLVAHLLFDGEITKSACVYTSRSEVLINKVKELMRLVYDYPPRVIESLPGVYRVSYFNVELAAYLKNKSEELLRLVIGMPGEFKKELLKTFFDDEGSVYFIGGKRAVRGYQHSIEILMLIQLFLRELNIDSKIDAEHSEVTISRRENLEKFFKEVNFSPGLCINGHRSNSVWGVSLEKRVILNMALDSYRND